MRMLLPALHYAVDRAKQNLTAKWHGGFISVATYYPDYGCALPTMTPDAAALKTARAVVSTLTGWPGVTITNVDPAVTAALTRAFAELPGKPLRHVHAIMVIHDGKLIAERYAAGFGPESPQLGYSMSKSVVNGLLGILVRQGKLDMAMPVAAGSGIRRSPARDHPGSAVADDLRSQPHRGRQRI